MEIKTIMVMGLELERWEENGVVADFGVEKDWATLYKIESKNEGKGYATALLKTAKEHYEGLGKKFGGSVAMSSRMREIYKRLDIEEYK